MIINTAFSSNEHIVRTTQQWESAAVKYKIIPNGCLCVELTPDGKTRVKIGEGNKYYEQLPYVDADINMEEITHIVEEYLQYYATKEYVDTKITTVDRKVDELDENVTSLEETVNGYDERINTVETDVSNLNTQVTDISDTINTIDDEIDILKKDSHTHDNKEILDNTTASFTTQDQTKLNGIEAHANNYSLPKATDSELGGIIVGNNLTITDGVLSANPGGYTLPPATKYALGGVIVGEGIDVDNTGKISVTGGGGGSEYVAGEGIRIDSHPSSNDEIVNTGVLNVTKDSNDDLVISKESGDTIIQLPNKYKLPIASDVELGGVMINGNNLSIDPSTGLLSATDTNTEYDAGNGIRLDNQVSGNDLIVNTGVLNVTKDSNDDLVISKESGDTTIQLDHYTLPKATDSSLGGIIVGDRLSIDDGVLSADDQSYELPKATDSALGGVIVGDNISVDENGTISTHAPYKLPEATDASLGGIIVGEGLEITDGVLSVTGGGEPYKLPPATDATLGGVIVGDGLDVTEEGVLSVTGGGSGITVDDELSTTSTNPVQNRVITNALLSITDIITNLTHRVEALEREISGDGSPLPGIPLIKAFGIGGDKTVIGTITFQPTEYDPLDYGLANGTHSNNDGSITVNGRSDRLVMPDYIPMNYTTSYTITGYKKDTDISLQFCTYIYDENKNYIRSISELTWFDSTAVKQGFLGCYFRMVIRYDSANTDFTLDDIGPITITFYAPQ